MTEPTVLSTPQCMSVRCKGAPGIGFGVISLIDVLLKWQLRFREVHLSHDRHAA